MIQGIISDRETFSFALQALSSGLLAFASFIFLHVWRTIEEVKKIQNEHATEIAVLKSRMET